MELDTGLPVVGMVGGGQLARMTHQAGIAMGLSLRVLAVDESDSAARVARHVTLGHHTDPQALRQFAEQCDVVTFDHEHVPNVLVAALSRDGHRVLPSAAALVYAQDKLRMRQRLAELGFPVPAWRTVTGLADLTDHAGDTGWPVVLKTVRGGYDGRGVWIAHNAREAAGLLQPGAAPDAPTMLAEAHVQIVRELACVVARSPSGQVEAWPVVETVQDRGICVEVIAPAPGLDPGRAREARELAVALATQLDVVGVMAVELFDTGGSLLVNELAMRPHNSGHWTIEGSRTSQFEQHLRAVLDYPLGDTDTTAPWTVMANVLGGSLGGGSTRERMRHLYAQDPAVRVHWYGKAARPGRKLGHVTVSGAELGPTRDRARRAARILSSGPSLGDRGPDADRADVSQPHDPQPHGSQPHGSQPREIPERTR